MVAKVWIQPLYSGDRSCATAAFDCRCRKALIGLGKYQLRPLPLAADLESAPVRFHVNATDLDFLIILDRSSAALAAASAASRTSSALLLSSPLHDADSANPTPDLLLLSLLNIRQNEAVLLVMPPGEPPSPFSRQPAPRSSAYLDRDRNKDTATERERLNVGSDSIRFETRPTDPTPL